ncbi:hypothetical protein SLS56_004714 [Neofusicoccum ribis]|uniref:Uncharacterized protein n=1 Tax=Neofusicoccum ribis TaxID=45134 RepID=A0ABR3SVF1_9PEZI
MLSKTIPATFMTVTPLASAQFAFVNGTVVPKNPGAGQNSSVSISSKDTSQQIENIALIFGLTPVGTEHPETLGNEVLREAYLGPPTIYKLI